MVISLKHHVKVPINVRWSKTFHKLLVEMDEQSRSERVEKMAEQNLWEQKFLYDAFSKSSISTKN